MGSIFTIALLVSCVAAGILTHRSINGSPLAYQRTALLIGGVTLIVAICGTPLIGLFLTGSILQGALWSSAIGFLLGCAGIWALKNMKLGPY